MTASRLIFFAGIGQLCLLVASVQVPFRLNWRDELGTLPRLHRQMHWVYGGYVVLSIVAFAAISILNAADLAGGTPLARALCVYIAVFWGVRLILQMVFDIGTYLTRWWMKAGYALLTFMFAAFTALYAWAAIHTSGM
jgi:hypothetical protein